MESPKSSSRSKSYFSDDDDSLEELLLYLINEVASIYSLPDLKALPDLLKISSMKELLLKIDTHFQEAASLLPNSGAEANSAFDQVYSNMKAIFASMDSYFLEQKEAGHFKFVCDINLKEININNLLNKSRPELHVFAKVVLVMILVSENRDTFIDRLSEGPEKYLDGFLDIATKYIDLSDDNTTDNIDTKRRRFTTRSSVLFNFKDPIQLFTSIDKLRKTINDLQEEKETLLKSLSKAEEERKTLNHQIDIFQSTIALFRVKEDDLNMEIADYKSQLNSFNSSDQSMIKNEMLLVEKSQQLSQLEEMSTVKIHTLNHKIASLQKEILDMHMANEQFSQLSEDNGALKEELSRVRLQLQELPALREENERMKEKVFELERDCNSYQSKIIVLRNDIKVEKQKTDVQSKTIATLQSKFKDMEQRPVAMLQPALKPLPEEINEDKVKELLMEIQEKELIICDLNKDMSRLKQHNDASHYQIQEKIVIKVDKSFSLLKCSNCISEEFIYKSSIPSKEKISKEIMKSREEIKKRDRDIAFLKKAYSELKAKSEEEYNMVSSSLYELALHLTKIKNEVNGSNSKQVA